MGFVWEISSSDLSSKILTKARFKFPKSQDVTDNVEHLFNCLSPSFQWVVREIRGIIFTATIKLGELCGMYAGIQTCMKRSM